MNARQAIQMINGELDAVKVTLNVDDGDKHVVHMADHVDQNLYVEYEGDDPFAGELQVTIKVVDYDAQEDA